MLKEDEKSTMIHTILFDLDNTLLDFNKAERAALTKTLLRLGIEPKEATLARYSELNLSQWKLLEQGKLSRSEVKIRRYQLLFDEIGAQCSAAKATELYESMLGIGHYYVEGAEELLHTLSARYRLYLVTNGTASVQRGRIQSADLSKYFEGIYISEDVGFDKPSEEYFRFCFAQIPDFRKEETVIVGDSITADIQGGKNAGIRTVWFNPEQAPNRSDIIPDYEIQNLKDLEGLLSQAGRPHQHKGMDS